MALTVKALPRVFTYNAINLDDPDPEMTPGEVKDFWANVYPELTQSQVDGPHMEDERVVYKFARTVGTKGYSVTDLAKGIMPEGGETHQKWDPNLMDMFARAVLDPSAGEDMVFPPSAALEPVP
jgi:PRTRC genetic system protein C